MSNLSKEDAISWAQFEFGQAQLIDKRLNKRLVKIASDFYRQPNASIPQASGSPAQAQAAYNYFDNDFIKVEQTLEPHLKRTTERCAENKTVLAISDTTYLDFSTQHDKKGMGALAKKESLGMLAHPTLAVIPEGLPLGIVHLQAWARSKEEFGKSNQRQNRLIAEKESQKWLNSYRATAELQAKHPETSFVCSGDRESDVFELFELYQSDEIPTTSSGKRPDLLIRAAQNRRVATEASSDHTTDCIWQVMEKLPVAGTYEIEVPRKEKQPARSAELEVCFAALTIIPPQKSTQKGATAH